MCWVDASMVRVRTTLVALYGADRLGNSQQHPDPLGLAYFSKMIGTLPCSANLTGWPWTKTYENPEPLPFAKNQQKRVLQWKSAPSAVACLTGSTPKRRSLHLARCVWISWN